MSVPTRPVLRYHGGKWRIAPWIVAHFPPHRVYVESFGGAASVLMRKPRAQAEFYNDLDGEIVNVFRVLRDPAQSSRLVDGLRLTPFARAEYEAAQTPSDDPVEQARRTMLKAWMGFGAGAISHAKAGFRVAYSPRRHTAREWANYPANLAALTERLSGVFIEQRPAVDVIQRYDGADVLHYVDPPYLGELRGERHRYRHELTEQEHRVLAEVLRSLAGHVVLSGYDSPLYADLFDGWTVAHRQTIDSASKRRTETLWLNPACAAALERAA